MVWLSASMALLRMQQLRRQPIKILMDKILIYTDGGCRGNPGIGGWGVWLRSG
jgi:hypothetical protein